MVRSSPVVGFGVLTNYADVGVCLFWSGFSVIV